MGKAAKLSNHVAMTVGIVEGGLQRWCVLYQRLEKTDGLMLMLDIFAVFKRQVKEHAFDREPRLVIIAGDRSFGRSQGWRIGFKAAGRAAKHIAGKLIEQNCEGEGGVRLL